MLESFSPPRGFVLASIAERQIGSPAVAMILWGDISG
jgi:hypothetical protein